MGFASEKYLYKFYLAVVLVTLVIPKAGDKAAGVPLTAANLLFAVLIAAAVPVLMKRSYPFIDKIYLIYFPLVLLPWLIIAGVGPFARIVLPLFVPLFIYYWIKPLTGSLITDSAKIYQVIRLIAVAIIIVVIYGLIQKLFGHYQTIIPGLTMSYTDAMTPDIFYLKSNQIGDTYKVTSTYQNGNVLGTNLVMLMMPVLAGFLYARGRGDRVLFGISAALSFAIIPMTMSRAALFGVITATGILFLFQKSRRIKTSIAVVFSLVFAVILTSPLLRSRMIGEFFDPTMNGRIKVIHELLNRVQPTLLSWISGLWLRFPHPHLNPELNIFSFSSENMYVTIMVWTGVIGVLLFLFAVGPVLLKLFKSIRATDEFSVESGLAAGVFAGLAGYLIQGLIEGAFHLIPTGFVFWLLVGLGDVLSREK